MTLFLASVTGPDEADVALAHGADIIDLNDPARGAPVALALAAVERVAGRRPVSAVAGEAPMDAPLKPAAVKAAAEAFAEAGVDYVKVDLFPAPRRADCIRALASVARRTKLIGVMFDDAHDDGLLGLMAEAGFAGAMLDTARKEAGRLLDRIGIPALKDFIGECRSRNLLAGLAGALEAPDIPRLLLLEPDILGFGRALRDGAGTIAPDAIAVIRGLIPLDARSAAQRDPQVGKVDYRLLAARGHAVEPNRGEVDRVLVRDFVLPVRIGAYAHERDKTQNVRFNVDVRVLRVGHAVEDMRDVFSYDIVTDGIRVLVAHEHFPFVETLAERLAKLILAHPRVAGVTIRVEKLDVGPGAVGVEITRERPAEAARVHQLFAAAARESDPKIAD